WFRQQPESQFCRTTYITGDKSCLLQFPSRRIARQISVREFQSCVDESTQFMRQPTLSSPSPTKIRRTCFEVPQMVTCSLVWLLKIWNAKYCKFGTALEIVKFPPQTQFRHSISEK